MVTGVRKGIPYCFLGTSSGKKKKAHYISQPYFTSEKTSVTIQADQILVGLQQLASNSNSANFIKNVKTNSKLPESLTTTMPTFDGKSEKLELLEDLLQTKLKTHRRRQNKLFPFSLASWYAADVQKHQQPEERAFSSNLDCVLRKMRKTTVDGYDETKLPMTCIQSNEPR